MKRAFFVEKEEFSGIYYYFVSAVGFLKEGKFYFKWNNGCIRCGNLEEDYYCNCDYEYITVEYENYYNSSDFYGANIFEFNDFIVVTYESYIPEEIFENSVEGG